MAEFNLQNWLPSHLHLGGKPSLKLLHVTPAYEPAWSAGGVVRGTGLLCRALAAMGHDVTVYTTNSSGDGWLSVPVDRAVDVEGVRVFYFHTAMPRMFKYSGNLAAACQKHLGEFDLMHVASFWNHAGIVACHAARRFGVPYVVSTDGAVDEDNFRRKRIKKWAYYKLFEERNLRRASAIRYVSEIEREQTAHLGLTTPSFMVPSGLDFTEFDNLPLRQMARSRLQISEDELAVGCMARLDRSKALDYLIRAFARVIGSFPNATLLLAGGDYGDEARLRALAGQLGLNMRVRFLGHIGADDRVALLAAADVMALVSLGGECFGNAAVESMAAGIPVLVSEHVGVSRTIANEDAGTVVLVEDVAIAEGLARLLGDPEARRRQGLNGHRSARQHFDMRVIARLMVQAYTDILEGKVSPECKWSNARFQR